MTAPLRGIPHPAPGSQHAIDDGYLCPTGDNAHGAGWLGSGLHWITGDCPLHGHAQAAMSNDWDEDRAPEGKPRCRICGRAAAGGLCADCDWHTQEQNGQHRGSKCV